MISHIYFFTPTLVSAEHDWVFKEPGDKQQASQRHQEYALLQSDRMHQGVICRGSQDYDCVPKQISLLYPLVECKCKNTEKIKSSAYFNNLYSYTWNYWQELSSLSSLHWICKQLIHPSTPEMGGWMAQTAQIEILVLWDTKNKPRVLSYIKVHYEHGITWHHVTGVTSLLSQTKPNQTAAVQHKPCV